MAAEELASRLGARAVQDLEQLLEDPGLHAVVLATPNHLHADQAVRAARAGKHIFCEKPMALNLADCDRMIRAAEEAGVRLMVGHVVRFFPVFRRCHELATSGELGQPLAVSIRRVTSGLQGFSAGWRSRMETSGGVLLEVHAHELDYLRCLCGDVETVYAQSARIALDASLGYDDTYYLTLRFRNGALGRLEASIASAIGEYRMMVQGSEGTLTNGGFGGPIQFCRLGSETPALEVPDVPMEDPYRRELRLFTEAVREGKEPPVTGRDGRAAVELALAAYRSAQLGTPVRLPMADTT
jgi:predicted dehydrogenase